MRPQRQGGEVMSKDQQLTLTAQLRSALGTIVLRCDEGDSNTDWLPVIRNIAAGALADTAGAADEIKRLQGIVDDVPKRADGCRWIPGGDYDLWHPDHVDSCDDIEYVEDEGWSALWYVAQVNPAATRCISHPVEDCYSTREAAEAAKGK